MKKIIILVMVLMAISFSQIPQWALTNSMYESVENETVTITKPCLVRDSLDYRTSALLHMWVEKGEKFKVLEKKVYYVYCEILSGSDHAGEKGWVWVNLLQGANRDTVGGEGCTFETGPGKKSKDAFYVKAGAKVKILEKTYSWLKLENDIAICKPICIHSYYTR
jgi:hypothetical protein